MKKFHGRRSALLVAVPALALLTAGFIQAQVQRPGAPRGTAPAQPAGRQPANRAGENLDQFFASCLILDNDNEIQTAKLAQSKADSPDVKKFAEMVVKDHEQFVRDLERFGGADIRARRNGAKPAGAANTRPNTGTAPAAAQAAPAAGAQATAPRGQAAAPGNMTQTFLQIKEELADQCRGSVKRELSGKSGEEFDDCYIGMQIAAHMKLVDTLVVLERHASPELQQVLLKGQETAQKHLDRAKQIMKDLDDGDRKTASRKSADDSTVEK